MREFLASMLQLSRSHVTDQLPMIHGDSAKQNRQPLAHSRTIVEHD